MDGLELCKVVLDDWTKIALFSNDVESHNSKKLYKSAFSMKFLLDDVLHEQQH